ncbi:MAG: sulfotransferase family 2 domain-containing protein [Pseudomonadota bacterium]
MTDRPPIFFVHIMKTGGTTVQKMIRYRLPEMRVFPNNIEDPNRLVAHVNIPYLRGIPAERVQRTRVFAGHFPYIATKMLGCEVQTMTLLRDPVERVISHLKHHHRQEGGFTHWSRELREISNPTLQQLYNDQLLKPMFFLNHQMRIFSINEQDECGSFLQKTPVDESRLEAACRNIEQVDCVGLLDDLEDFRLEINQHFQLHTRPVKRSNEATNKVEVPQSLRDQIAEDNRLDIEFYKFAAALHRKRRGAAEPQSSSASA